MGWRERIERKPQAMHGRLRIRGTEIAVSAVLENLAANMNVREVLESYPTLSEEDVRACVAWAAECVHAVEGEPAANAGSPAGTPQQPTSFKAFLRSMPDVGDDADFDRPLDYGRPEVE